MPVAISLTKPLQGLRGKLCNGRIRPRCRFSQMSDGAEHVALVGQYPSQIQVRASELRLQPDCLLILMRRFLQVPLAREQTAEQFVSISHLRVGLQRRFHRCFSVFKPVDGRQFQRLVVKVRRITGPQLRGLFKIEKGFGRVTLVSQHPAPQVVCGSVIRIRAQRFPQFAFGAIRLTG